MQENDQCDKMQGKIKEFLDQQFQIYKQDRENLIPILNEVQEKFGYIPKEAQKEISEFLKIPMAEIYGVITFYKRFTLEPRGKYVITVCLGTACFVNGSREIMDRLTKRLGIKPGETTNDGLFSIDETRCVGACGLAPVFTINGEVHGKATIKKLDKAIDDILEKENKRS